MLRRSKGALKQVELNVRSGKMRRKVRDAAKRRRQDSERAKSKTLGMQAGGVGGKLHPSFSFTEEWLSSDTRYLPKVRDCTSRSPTASDPL